MIYLDSAATTLQKPRTVARAAAQAITTLASPGRGGHRPAMEAGATAFACREEAAALFGMESPERVVFTFNATHALNIALHSLVRPGMKVVISGYEHNSVTRPLYAMPQVEVRVADAPLFDPEAMVRRFKEELEAGVDVAVCTHVSNVFGYVLPVEEIADLCSKRGVPLVVDAAQSAGCLPIDGTEWNAAFIAMPGHKGLYGPQGTGLLLCSDADTTPVLSGGTGSNSLEQSMPEFLPDRLEAGTHNIPGIAGLREGLRYVRSRGTQSILAHERSLIQQMVDGLRWMDGVEVFAARREEDQAGVLSFRVAGWDCESLGEELGRRGVAVRAGLHCSPTAHRTAGTLASGTIRASVSAFNTPAEVEGFLSILRRTLSDATP